jgi:hypothetical protein
MRRRESLRGWAALATVLGCRGASPEPPPPPGRVRGAASSGARESTTQPESGARPEPAPSDAHPGHVLVVGGTGMLRPVAMELARRGHATTVIARSREPLADMAEESGGFVHPLPLDYRELETLEAELRRAIHERGALTLIVAWIHASAPAAPLAIARVAAHDDSALRYVHVLGSAADDPSAPDPRRRQAFEAIGRIEYEEVILGFVHEPDGSRWLTDAEISAGVLAAIDAPAPRHLVGVTRPWSDRP